MSDNLYQLKKFTDNGGWSVIKAFGNLDSACGWAYAQGHKETMDNSFSWEFNEISYKVTPPYGLNGEATV